MDVENDFWHKSIRLPSEIWSTIICIQGCSARKGKRFHEIMDVKTSKETMAKISTWRHKSILSFLSMLYIKTRFGVNEINE
jgi:hypothetical protein